MEKNDSAKFLFIFTKSCYIQSLTEFIHLNDIIFLSETTKTLRSILLNTYLYLYPEQSIFYGINENRDLIYPKLKGTPILLKFLSKWKYLQNLSVYSDITFISSLKPFFSSGIISHFTCCIKNLEFNNEIDYGKITSLTIKGNKEYSFELSDSINKEYLKTLILLDNEIINQKVLLNFNHLFSLTIIGTGNIFPEILSISCLRNLSYLLLNTNNIIFVDLCDLSNLQDIEMHCYYDRIFISLQVIYTKDINKILYDFNLKKTKEVNQLLYCLEYKDKYLIDISCFSLLFRLILFFGNVEFKGIEKLNSISILGLSEFQWNNCFLKNYNSIILWGKRNYKKKLKQISFPLESTKENKNKNEEKEKEKEKPKLKCFFTSLNKLPLKEEFKDLIYLKKLKLCCYSSLIDVRTLTHIQNLSIINCTSLSDVSSLKNIKTLNLFGCNKVKDVSELIHIENLNLSCTSVTDVSMLGNVKFLVLELCNVQDILALQNNRCLQLNRINFIHSIGSFTNIYYTSKDIGGTKKHEKWKCVYYLNPFEDLDP